MSPEEAGVEQPDPIIEEVFFPDLTEIVHPGQIADDATTVTTPDAPIITAPPIIERPSAADKIAPLSPEQLAAMAQAAADARFRDNLGLQKSEPKKPRIIGVSGARLVETSQKSDDTLSANDALDVTLDTTTQPDRALVTIQNNRGYDVYMTGLSIYGKRIMRYDKALVSDKLKRDDDIRRNGEKVKTISNDYIITAAQVDKLADYWYKYTQTPKHIYAISIKGIAPWYETGEWYRLQLGTADTNEYIDVTAECYDVQCEKRAGTIGHTIAMFREVVEGWTKTTLYAARAQGGGAPGRRTRRSNNVVVAAYGYHGTADYYCDGTADDVQINAAIDYVAQTWGGGRVELTQGTYLLAAKIEVKANITLAGGGSRTIITFGEYDEAGSSYCIYINAAGVELRDFIIDGSDTNRNINTVIGVFMYTSADANIRNVSATRIKNQFAGVTVGFFGYSINGILTNCSATLISTSAAGIAAGFSGAKRVTDCVADSVTATGGGSGYGFRACKSCLGNKSTNNTTAAYYVSYADAGTTNACADTAAGGYNS